VLAFLGGDGEALAELVGRYAPLALAVVRRWARPHDAGALALQTVLRAVLVARRVLTRDPQRAFVFRRTLLRASLKVSVRRMRTEVRLARARLDELGGPPPVLEGGSEARSRRARAVVRLLAHRERTALTFRLDAELPVREIAEVLDITEQAARQNLHRAARWLRDALPPAIGHACPEHAVSLSLRAAGALEAPEALRLEAHLAGCAGCRAEAEATAHALACASLGPPSEAERLDVQRLPRRTLAELERRERRSRIWPTVVVGIAVTLVAALAAFVFAWGPTGPPG
jgi:RNA polymerase sigma factor (sigma-70 family)